MAISSWEAVENALHSAVVTTSGLSEEVVRWDDQAAKAPGQGPYIRMSLGGPQRVGHAELSTNFDAGRAAHLEVERRALLSGEVAFQVQVFDGAAAGNSSSRAVAALIRSKLELRSIRDALNAAGIGVLEIGSVQTLGGNRRADFEPRAILDLRLLVSEAASDFVGYFNRVTVENEDTNQTFEIP